MVVHRQVRVLGEQAYNQFRFVFIVALKICCGYDFDSFLLFFCCCVFSFRLHCSIQRIDQLTQLTQFNSIQLYTISWRSIDSSANSADNMHNSIGVRGGGNGSNINNNTNSNKQKSGDERLFQYMEADGSDPEDYTR